MWLLIVSECCTDMSGCFALSILVLGRLHTLKHASGIRIIATHIAIRALFNVVMLCMSFATPHQGLDHTYW